MTIDGGWLDWGVVPRLEAVLGHAPPEAAVFVDIPIGLPAGSEERQADRSARRLLGWPRRASVFRPPCRGALEAADYPAALACQRAATGKGLSRQAFNIAPKIREVDRLLRARPLLARRVLESHPELCLLGLAGRPMQHAKRTRAGREERLAVLSAVFPAARHFVGQVQPELRRAGAAPDDLVDALTLAVCAAHRAACVPVPDPPERDACGLPMAIHYWPRGGEGGGQRPA